MSTLLWRYHPGRASRTGNKNRWGGPDGAFAYEILYRLQQQRVKVPTFSGDGKENGIALIRPYSASPGFADWLQSGRDGKLSRTALHIKHDTGTRNTSHTTFGAGAGFD